MRFTVIMAALAVSSGAFAQAPAPQGWGLITKHRPGTGDIRVCLYRNQATKKWVATSEAPYGTRCEVLTADFDCRTYALTYPDIDLSNRTYCSTLSTAPKYSLCYSAFAMRSGVSGSYASIDVAKLSAALREAQIDTVLDDRAAEIAAARAEEFERNYAVQRRAFLDRYRAEFETANTVEAIKAFISKYAVHDTDSLIPQLQPRLAELERQDYLAATSADGLRRFVGIYRSNDPAELIGTAQSRLAALEAKESTAKALAAAEQKIVSCKRMTKVANQAIAREQQIGAVSGYVDKAKLHAAGDYIVSCQSILPAAYVEYKRLGGAKTLAAIQ